MELEHLRKEVVKLRLQVYGNKNASPNGQLSTAGEEVSSEDSEEEFVDELPEPKPHYNSVGTIVKILVKKGVLQAVKIGNTHQYSPSEDYDYREAQIGDIKKKFFGDSLPNMLAYFAKNETLSEEEKEELIKIIKSKKS